jgi:methyl-accepting chemotaxis protein
MADTNDAAPVTPPRTRLGRWRVASRLNLATVFGFLCFAAISGLTFGGSTRLGEGIDRLIATGETVSSVASVRLAVQQLGALQDRLIAQGSQAQVSQANGDILAAYEAESAKATAALKAASIGLSDGPDLDTLTDGLAEHADQFRALAQSLSADPATARPDAVRDIKELQGYLSASADSLADVAARQSADTADRTFRDQRVFNLLILGAGGALAILFAAIALYLVRTVTSPLVDLGDTAMGLARGQLMIEPPARGNLDDIGRIARGLEMMRKTLIEYEERTPRKTPTFRLTDAPLPPELPEPSVLAAQLAETAAALSAAILRLKADAEAVAATGEKAVSPLKTASTAASQAAAQARSLSVELPKVSEIMLAASKPETTPVWEKASVEVRRAIGQTETLAEAPARMASAIAAIRTIAEEARLLGLNASLQAARAAAGGTPDFDAVAQRLKALSRQAIESVRDVETWLAEADRAAPSTVAALWDVDAALGQIRDAEAANAAELGKRAETIRSHGTTAQQLATRASAVGTALVAAIAEAENLKEAAQSLVDAVTMLERDSQTLERSAVEDLAIPGFAPADIFSPSDPDPSST